MSLADDLADEIDGILDQEWDIRDGQVIPETSDIALAGGGVNLKCVILYADLADSTGLAMWNRKVAARIFKAFLACSTRLIRANGGSVRSFDGDRVMGVFIGGNKNTNAAKCALQINWMFQNLLKPKFGARFEKIGDGTHPLAHCTGVDTGDTLVVRAGIRNNNDLVWVGRAPNVAAKMCALRNDPYFSWISGDVYDSLADSAKFSGDPQQNMWQERCWKNGPITRIFRSSWLWKP